jgi:hypothetical protein
VNDPTLPRFPVYIPSKSRAAIAVTPRVLDWMGVPWRMVVERSQLDDYRRYWPDDRLIVLDPAFQRSYDTCDDDGDSKSLGSGPARNFIWEHSISEGHDWHWIMDDNIKRFIRLHENRRSAAGDGAPFRIMEEFVLRYRNVAMAGPNYRTFATPRTKSPPFRLNTRIFSCNLIRNSLPMRWRGRYNEDAILSIDMLKRGWCTVLFIAFLQDKVPTQKNKGGNTEAFYAAEGTLPKSKMLVDVHPDVARLAWRYNRWHHYVDFRRFQDRGLLRDPNVIIPDESPFQFTKTTQTWAPKKGTR